MPRQGGLYTGLLECPDNTAVASPQSKWLKKEQGRSPNVFHALVSEATPSTSYLLHRSALFSVGEGYARA